ncbi:MAG TPA: fused MFS/spermidine synthase [Gammaproteobacteria bacterium]|nr:fused MFS/spermidine synthase [Gammaproteobacteria bacterium]
MRTDPSGYTTQAAQSRALLLFGCFLLSGFAALLYQVAWMRQFAFVFGTSELAVVTVLAAYLAGLAAGAAVAARYVTRIARPLRAYGLLEAGIGGSALLVPLVLGGVGLLYVWLLGDQPAPPDAAAWGQPLFYVVLAFAILAVPTALMGATLPLVTRSIVLHERQIGPLIALLYGINTLGAVLGALTAGFVLLPRIGLTATVLTGAAINLAIFAVVIGLARRWTAPVAAPRASDETSSNDGRSTSTTFVGACLRPLLRGGSAAVFRNQPAWILPVMLISGANAFVYEVLWTRMLTHVLGGSIYSFATMLAAFLGGIALGGALSGGLARDRERASNVFVYVQLGVALLSILIYTLLGPMIPEARGTAAIAAYAVGVMLPATIFLGASFPLAVRILAQSPARAGADTAQVYAWNTAGAIPGAILAGLLLIPALGFEGTIKLAAATNAALALWAAAFVARRRLVPIALAAGGLAVTILAYSPARPGAVISSTGFPLDYSGNANEVFYAVGRSATVLLLEEDGVYYLRSNGLPEASIAARGSPPQQDAEKWLAALPVAARPAADSMLLIGFGGGVTLEGVPPSISSVDVVELEPEIITANRALSGRRNSDPLADSRFNVVLNDARNALRLTSKRYDVIIAQPSHPWTGGAAHLYTRDFLAEAKTHLDDSGVLVQWINAEFVDAELLRVLAATLLSEFDNVRLYHPTSRVLVFLASDAALDPELQLARSGAPLTDDIMHYSRMGMNGVEDLIAAIALDEAGVRAFAEGARISTDDNLLAATRSRSRADGLRDSDLHGLFAPHDPLLNSRSWIYTQLGERIDFGYVTRRLARLSKLDRAIAAAEAQPDESTRLLMVGLLYAERGQPEQALVAYRGALERRPENSQARYLLVEPGIGRLLQGTASRDVAALAERLPASAAAIIEGARYAAAQDWEALARLDGTLSRVGVTDAWYPDVVRLRTEWRSKVTQNVAAFAFDALRLIDRAILIQPTLNLYLLRAATGIAMGDGGVAIESSRHIVRVTRENLQLIGEGDGRIAQRDLVLIRQNMTAIMNNLEGELVAGSERRAEAVRQSANQILRYLDAATAAEQE